jgi:hypothetical protein
MVVVVVVVVVMVMMMMMMIELSELNRGRLLRTREIVSP